MVERFTASHTVDSGSGVVADDNGWLVRHSDYAALQAELETVKGELALKTAECEFWRLADATSQAQLAEAKLAGGEAVRVKPLKWTELSTGWIAHTSFHAYEVVKTDQGFMATYANRDFAWGAEDAMKVAAQADYERRILSALTHPAPTHEDAGRVTPMREAREALEGVNDWLGQRSSGEPTTNSEAAIFRRVHGALQNMDAFSLSDPDHTSGEVTEATHRHKKRGSEYVLLGIGKMQCDWWEHAGVNRYPVDMREVAIYRSVDDGSLWVRPREEFEDGRFEALRGDAS